MPFLHVNAETFVIVSIKQLKINNMEENLKLLLKDLCCRLPYKVKCKYSGEKPMIGEVTNNIGVLSNIYVDKECPFEIYGFADVKPYLRSMSSMTEEEKKEYEHIAPGIEVENGVRIPNVNQIDWLNSHHFDYRGLIEKNLALEAPKGMYNLND